MKQTLFSYVVAYDSGFAPNPFHGYCTLATCKPKIRKKAEVGDWVLGTGSANQAVRRGGYLVHAMKVTEVISTTDYWNDPRFQTKKPRFGGSWLWVSGDNIYEHAFNGNWKQLPSYHSRPDGTQRLDHTSKDTRVLRILVSDDFVYFGAKGPQIPHNIANTSGGRLIKQGIGHFKINNDEMIHAFERWIRDLGKTGFCGEPWDWRTRINYDKR